MAVNTRTLMLAGVGAVALGGGWLLANGKLPMARKPAPVETAKSVDRENALSAAISVAKVSVGSFVDRVMVTGTLVAREEILVGPEVEGLRIVAVLADEGQRVKQGDVLAQLVTDTLDAQLAQNEASLAKASASIGQAKSNIAAADAKRTETTKALDRGRPLRQSGVISEATQDTRESAATTAQAQYVAALDALKVAEADKKQIEAVRRDLEWRRARADVRAPADGVISRRVARLGGYAAGAGDAMFRIIARGEVELDAEVPESVVGRVRVGHEAVVEIAGAGEVKGKVRLVSPEIDKASRLGRVRIFLGDDAKLHVGAFARGLITVAQSKGLSVPSSAIQYSGPVASVQLVKDGRIVTQKVEIGLSTAGSTEITKGLALDDVVVARAGTFLRDGDAVRPILAPQQMTESLK